MNTDNFAVDPKLNQLVENNSTFLQLTAKFDHAYQTQTYVANLTLQEIWDNFMIKNNPDSRWYADNIQQYIHKIVESKTSAAFKRSHILWSDDPDVGSGEIGKMNSVYLMKRDIVNGVPFKYPISIAILKNHQYPIHPGGTRMMFAGKYNKTIPVVFTDYTGQFRETFRHIQAHHPMHLTYNFEKEPLLLVEVPSDHKFCSSAFDKALNPDLYDLQGKKIPSPDRNVVWIKQIVDYNLDYLEHTYHKPTRNHSPRKFELSEDGNRIYVDDMLIHEKVDGLWSINLDEGY